MESLLLKKNALCDIGIGRYFEFAIKGAGVKQARNSIPRDDTPTARCRIKDEAVLKRTRAAEW